jgi:hypothetical protein
MNVYPRTRVYLIPNVCVHARVRALLRRVQKGTRVQGGLGA